MNLLAWLNPYRWLLYGALALSIAVGVPLIVHRYNDRLREEGRAEVRAADKLAAAVQTARNRDLQRAAELRYTVTAAARDRFITRTITEVRHATESLAACPVSADAVRVLNAAAECARGDSPTACGAGDQMPGAR